MVSETQSFGRALNASVALSFARSVPGVPPEPRGAPPVLHPPGRTTSAWHRWLIAKGILGCALGLSILIIDWAFYISD